MKTGRQRGWRPRHYDRNWPGSHLASLSRCTPRPDLGRPEAVIALANSIQTGPNPDSRWTMMRLWGFHAGRVPPAGGIWGSSFFLLPSPFPCSSFSSQHLAFSTSGLTALNALHDPFYPILRCTPSVSPSSTHIHFLDDFAHIILYHGHLNFCSHRSSL